VLGFSPLSDQPLASVPAPLASQSTDIVPMVVMIGSSQIQCFGIGTAYIASPNYGILR